MLWVFKNVVETWDSRTQENNPLSEGVIPSEKFCRSLK
jgi:hypothetical protein